MITPNGSLRDVVNSQFEGDDEGHVTNKEERVEAGATPAPSTEVDKTNPAVAEEVLKPFAEKPDLKGKTPEELDQIYKEWNLKYTQTRQKETAELKEYRTKVSQYEERLKQLESAGNKLQSPDLQAEKNAVRHDFELGNLTVQQYTEKILELSREESRRIAREEFTSLKKQDSEESYQQSALDHFTSADERLDRNNPNFNMRMFKSLATDMADLLDEHIAKNGTSVGFDYKGNVSRLISEFDQEIDRIVSSRVQRNTSAARDRAGKFAKSSITGKNTPSIPTGKKNIRDIIASTLE